MARSSLACDDEVRMTRAPLISASYRFVSWKVGIDHVDGHA